MLVGVVEKQKQKKQQNTKCFRHMQRTENPEQKAITIEEKLLTFSSSFL